MGWGRKLVGRERVGEKEWKGRPSRRKGMGKLLVVKDRVSEKEGV